MYEYHIDFIELSMSSNGNAMADRFGLGMAVVDGVPTDKTMQFVMMIINHAKRSDREFMAIFPAPISEVQQLTSFCDS